MYFIYHNSEEAAEYWRQCESKHAPYIEIRDAGSAYRNIFYDITNLSGDLEAISQEVKELYLSYVNFCLIPYADIEPLLDQYYFFNLLVKIDHAEAIAQQLFIYLSSKTE